MQIHNYPKEFVERTLKLIESDVYKKSKENELEVTFIMNCLLGLIVLSYERLNSLDNNIRIDFFKNRLFDNEIKDFIPKNIARINLKNINKKIREKVNSKSLIYQLENNINLEDVSFEVEKYEQIKNITLKEFLKNIRNGIAHQNIMPINNSEHWKGIRIWNKNEDGIKNFEVEFEISELKKFAIFIANKYLKSLD